MHLIELSKRTQETMESKLSKKNSRKIIPNTERNEVERSYLVSSTMKFQNKAKNTHPSNIS